MVNALRVNLALCVLVVFCACKKNPNIGTDITKPETEIPVIPTPPKDSVEIPGNSKVIEVGTGSGNLSIDGKTLGITGNTVIKIKGGSYSDIQIANIVLANGTAFVLNDGLVEIVGNRQMTLSNLKNVTISGNGTPGIDKGFVFRDKSSDAASIQLKNDINDFTLKYVSFSNVNTYNAIQYNSEKVYNGSESSYSKNLKFLYIDAVNTGTLIRFRGSVENGTITGLVKNVEVAYLNFRDSRAVGSVVALENAEAYDLHNNTVQDINQSNDNHNGIFYVQGNGKFYNNLIKNHQGNAIRAWAYSIGTTPQEVLIFNNIVINSRMYSGFELQAFERNMLPGKTTFVNAKVFNNTCGNLLPKEQFPAQILDLYGLQGGKTDIFNNLGYKFTLVGQNNTNFIYNDMGPTPPNAFNNKYFKTAAEAGIVDENKLMLGANSAAKNAGAALTSQNLQISATPAISFDIYNTPRSLSKPSIGAVE
ncbi:hypothetical protein [Pedobacter gandavensis]|uniref:Right-handed parallel beta-helix repeat-containing protein n=1 Tax=Pedobacter gandavensis TaxID=2679963 RepID=A0ABR6ET87_9SPHI|nr:hypothetical protein [Pedobacter gandavensis]MBB2148417.1 hypothetical protein [Pedobacter gandavensis]